MGLIANLARFFGGKKGKTYSVEITEHIGKMAELCFRELAFWNVANEISKAISKCEFQTFQNNKLVQDDDWYLWNVEPNPNENSSQFIHKLISRLYEKNECLVVEVDKNLFVADGFTRNESTIYEDVFADVTIGDFSFYKQFKASEVLYFKLSEENMNIVMKNVYSTYSKLLEYNMNAFQCSKGTKGVLKHEGIPTSGPVRDEYDRMINESVAPWLKSDSGALPLGKGQEWVESTKRTYSNESSRDTRAMIDDIFDFTAKSFGVPPALLRGDVQGTDEALEQFLTFCIDPLAKMLSEEISRKRYGKKGYKQGFMLKIDTKQLKHIDLFNMPNSVDKLIASAVYSVNDVLRKLGEPTIDEEWADKHMYTKNYSFIDEFLQALEGETQKGGETK